MFLNGPRRREAAGRYACVAGRRERTHPALCGALAARRRSRDLCPQSRGLVR
jgi:hypothetical protein